MKLFKYLSGRNRFLYLTIIAFVFISTFALSLAKKDVVSEITKIIEPRKVSDLPVLASNSTFPIFSAEGVIAVDVDSGVTLYEKNADQPLLPASTTKIMTALVTLDSYSLSSTIKVVKTPIEGQVMGLYDGEEMTVENLLNGLLVYSANDAAMVLAQNYPGGTDAFVAAMNQKAKNLGLTQTHFENPVGLDGNAQTSTAKDMVHLSEVAMRNPVFAKIVGTQKIDVSDTTGKVTHHLTNINQLLGKVDGVAGVKTGWTENARENLVTYIVRDNRKVMIAVLGSQDRFGETKELIDWIYTNYQWKDVSFKL